MLKFELNREFCEFYGVLIGDGCLSSFRISSGKQHYEIRIDGNADTDYFYYLYFLLPLIKKVFDKAVRINFRKDCNGIFVRFKHKQLALFLNKELNFPFGKKKNIAIHEKILNDDKKILNVLRGIFDTDGCLYFTKNNSKKRSYPIIEISTHSKFLLDQLATLLPKFGFKTKISFFYDAVKLHGKKNLKIWMRLIGTHHIDKMSKYVFWKKFRYCPEITELNFEKRINYLDWARSLVRLERRACEDDIFQARKSYMRFLDTTNKNPRTLG